MNYLESNNLAIIACPGGEEFANLTIKNLKHIYARKLYQQSEKLAKRYNTSSEDMIQV